MKLTADLDNRRIVILGAHGQVGSALVSLLGSRAVPLDRDAVDLSDENSLLTALDSVRPGAIINAAAYTQVDQAENEEEAAFAVNARAPGALARFCAANEIPFVHYSTDYVFNGSGEKPWTEDAPTAPLNAYGRTKLAGELETTNAGGRFLVFRTSWICDALGKNFLRTMLRLGAERETLRVVGDQTGAPTYAPHLAAATLKALDSALALPRFPSGTYHLCNAGETSWHGFAEAIFREARERGMPLRVQSIEKIASEQFPTPAKRPSNSRLSCEKARDILGVALPPWQEGLKEAMRLIR